MEMALTWPNALAKEIVGTVVAPTSRSVPSTTGAARPVNVAANFGPIS